MKKTGSRMAVEGDLLVPRESREKKKPKDNLFGWTVFLLILIGLVFACWIGSFYVLEHPENPRSYRLLRKLKKIDPPKRFEPTGAPKGRFYSVAQLFKLYNEKSDAEMAQINAELLRAYIGNYSVKESEVPYLMGHFSVVLAQALRPSDMLTSGYVVLARSLDEPKVFIEQLYPADPENLPGLEQMLIPGVEVKLERTYDLSAVLHVEKWADGRMQITIVPLNYDAYGSGDGPAVHLSPPPSLNLAGPLPVFGANQFDEVGTVAAKAESKDSSAAIIARTGPTPDQSVLQVAKALPVESAAFPIPKKSSKAVAVAEPKVLPAIPLTTPASKENPGEGNVTRKAVIASSASGVSKSRSQWQTYKPGQMPRGRLVGISEMEALAKSGEPKTITYLQGSFMVKAIDGNRAVLRADSRDVASGKTRVIVEYPGGQTAPPNGTQLSRNSGRPFQITSVQQDSSGQVNVFVREITEP